MNKCFFYSFKSRCISRIILLIKVVLKKGIAHKYLLSRVFRSNKRNKFKNIYCRMFKLSSELLCCNFNDRAAPWVLACLQAVTGGFIGENPFRSLIGRHLRFLRCTLPGTSGREQKSREGDGGRREKPPAGGLSLAQDKI